MKISDAYRNALDSVYDLVCVAQRRGMEEALIVLKGRSVPTPHERPFWGTYYGQVLLVRKKHLNDAGELISTPDPLYVAAHHVYLAHAPLLWNLSIEDTPVYKQLAALAAANDLLRSRSASVQECVELMGERCPAVYLDGLAPFYRINVGPGAYVRLTTDGLELSEDYLPHLSCHIGPVDGNSAQALLSVMRAGAPIGAYTKSATMWASNLYARSVAVTYDLPLQWQDSVYGTKCLVHAPRPLALDEPTVLSDTALAIWSDSASVALYLYPREGYTTHVSLAPVPLPAHKIGARGYNAYGYELPYEVWRGAVVARLSLSCGTRYIISERSVYRGRTMLSSIRGLSL